MITAVEQAILDRIASEFEGRLKSVQPHPGAWDSATIQRMAVNAPGVWVAFAGGRDAGEYFPTINARWNCYIVTEAAIRAARTRGDARAIGAYKIMQLLVPMLDGWAPLEAQAEPEHRLQLAEISNRFSFEHDRRGLCVYEVGFVHDLDLTYAADGSELDEFLTFGAEYSSAPEAEADATDDITFVSEEQQDD